MQCSIHHTVAIKLIPELLILHTQLYLVHDDCIKKNNKITWLLYIFLKTGTVIAINNCLTMQ